MAGKFKLAFGSLLRSLHQLWLEVTGAFLLAFSAAFGFYAVKELSRYPESADNLWGVAGAAALSLLTLGFGIHSFWKSRKLR